MKRLIPVVGMCCVAFAAAGLAETDLNAPKAVIDYNGLKGGIDYYKGGVQQKRMRFAADLPIALSLSLSQQGSTKLDTIRFTLEKGRLVANLTFATKYHTLFHVYVAVFNKDGKLIAAGHAKVDSLHGLARGNGWVRDARGPNTFRVDCGTLAPSSGAKKLSDMLKQENRLIVSAWVTGTC